MRDESLHCDWWKRHFDRKSLLGYGLPGKTVAEVKGILKMLGFKKQATLLDLCCGAGRHAIELARKGHRVTGLDWSDKLLSLAREESSRQGVSLEFKKGDMRRLRFANHFEAVVNLFTSFGYFETESEDLTVLRGVRRALKPGGLFLIDVLNKEWLMRHFTPTYWQRHPEHDVERAFCRLYFDPLTSRLTNHRTLFIRKGRKREATLRFKVYTLHDLGRMLNATGFKIENVYGGFDLRPYGLDTFRMIVLARKKK